MLAPPPGSSCRMAPLLFDLGTERHEGPDIGTRFCWPTSLWEAHKESKDGNGAGDLSPTKSNSAHPPVRAAAVPLAALVATFHPLD